MQLGGMRSERLAQTRMGQRDGRSSEFIIGLSFDCIRASGFYATMKDIQNSYRCSYKIHGDPPFLSAGCPDPLEFSLKPGC